MEYNTLTHYTYSLKYHIVFCPKYRRKILKDKIADRLKELLLEQCSKLQIRMIEMEIMPDHVHLLVDCPPQIAPVDVVKKFKQQTSIRLKKEFPEIKRTIPCLWTRSCFIASVGAVSLDIITEYIKNQKKGR